MTWYNPSTWFETAEDLEAKANPAQTVIMHEQGLNISTDSSITYLQAFDKLEAVNRGVNMIVSACSSLDFDVKDKLSQGVVGSVRQKTLHNLLNFAPNPYQSVQEFRNAIFTDFLLEGNIFIYYDGAHLYHMPAVNMQIHPDPKTFVNKYTYNNTVNLAPNEIIHIKDLSSGSIYRGSSRLSSADRNIKILYKMQTFQEQFFENGAIPGIVISTDNTLSQVAKDKTIAGWIRNYSPKNGARKPLLLDSGLKISPIAATSFKEMDFDISIKTHDAKILNSLGIPPILMEGGNNANISPNLRLFYLETVIPIVTKYVSAMERYFGYDVEPVTSSVSALQPEMKEQAAYFSTLVNGGILKPNEAREALRYEKDTDPESDKLRIPANIAGSAANPSEGGAPKKPAEAPKPPAK